MIKRASFIAVLSFGLMFTASAQSTFHTAFLNSFDSASGKVMQLADAFSEEGYSWRPAEGIRSVSEAMMHVAGANFFFANMLGSKPPEGVNPRELESITDKVEAMKMLKMSVEHVRKAVEKTSPDAMEEEVERFGNKMGVVLLVGDHMNEHLGQLIAYARSSGVTPPWSN